jgi:hypothetical protein
MTIYYTYDLHFIFVGAVVSSDQPIPLSTTTTPPALSGLEVARWETNKWTVLKQRPDFTNLHKIDFLKLFTQPERISIVAEAKTNLAIADWEYMLGHSTTISLLDTEILSGIPALEMMGLIGAGRAAQILAGIPPC